jgi:hypothetical protein
MPENHDIESKGIQNCSLDVDQRQDQRIFDSLVFGLNVVNGIAVLYVCVESSDHKTLDDKVGHATFGSKFS